MVVPLGRGHGERDRVWQGGRVPERRRGLPEALEQADEVHRRVPRVGGEALEVLDGHGGGPGDHPAAGILRARRPRHRGQGRERPRGAALFTRATLPSVADGRLCLLGGLLVEVVRGDDGRPCSCPPSAADGTCACPP